MELTGHFYIPATLPLRKKPLVPNGQEAGWVLRASLGTVVKRRKSLPLMGIET
jgi:hypothetical protein